MSDTSSLQVFCPMVAHNARCLVIFFIVIVVCRASRCDDVFHLLLCIQVNDND